MTPPLGRFTSAQLRGTGRRTKRELATVQGLSPPVRHHALVAEAHARGGPYRYREYVSFQSAFVCACERDANAGRPFNRV